MRRPFRDWRGGPPAIAAVTRSRNRAGVLGYHPPPAQKGPHQILSPLLSEPEVCLKAGALPPQPISAGVRWKPLWAPIWCRETARKMELQPSFIFPSTPPQCLLYTTKALGSITWSSVVALHFYTTGFCSIDTAATVQEQHFWTCCSKTFCLIVLGEWDLGTFPFSFLWCFLIC